MYIFLLPSAELGRKMVEINRMIIFSRQQHFNAVRYGKHKIGLNLIYL
jgi:hypothetical protein